MYQQDPPTDTRPVTAGQLSAFPQRRLIAYGIVAAAVLVAAVAGQQLNSSTGSLKGAPWVESILLLGMIAALSVVDSPRPHLRGVGVSVGAAVFVGVWLPYAVGLSNDSRLSLLSSPVLCAGASCAWIAVRRERGIAYAAVPLAVLLGVFAARGLQVQLDSEDGWLAPLWAVVPVAATAWLAWVIERVNRPPSSVNQPGWPPLNNPGPGFPTPPPAAVHQGLPNMPYPGVPRVQRQALSPGMYASQANPQGFGPYAGNAGRQNTAAIIALVLSLLMLSLPAVVLGHIGRGQIRRSGEQGWQVATAGLIIGYLGMVIYVLAGVVYGLAAAT